MIDNISRLIEYARNEPKWSAGHNYDGYCHWRDTCLEIAHALKIQTDFHPENERKLSNGLKSLDEKMAGWKQNKSKYYHKYMGKLEALTIKYKKELK